VIVLLLVIAGLYLFWTFSETGSGGNSAPPPAGPVPVSTITLAPQDIPYELRFLGQTAASQVVELRARVAGYLDERTFEEGQLVEQGQQLFQIDPRPFQVALAEAQARLAGAQATLARAQEHLGRLQSLQAENAATAEELDVAQADLHVAEAEVSLQEAQIAAAELQIDYASVESPITGLIGRALKDNGSYVDSGPEGLLAVVQQVDPIYVEYAVTEQEILRFQRQVEEQEIQLPDVSDLELEITLADGSVYPHRGHLNFVDVQVDESTGTSLVRGQVPNPDMVLKPGQSVHASVLGITRTGALLVPQSAVMQTPTGSSVYVVGPEGTLEQRPVTMGRFYGDDWVVEAGLAPGDRIVTGSLMRLRPGMTVQPTGETPAPSRPPAQPAPAQPAPDQPAASSAPPDSRS
jgi:membrane fusion protein (multidrug efflux system)